MRQGFEENFGDDWRNLPVTEDLVSAVRQAAREMTEVAAILERRAGPAA
jgi:hypothetical protein